MLTILLTAVCTYALFLLVHWIPFQIWTVVHRTRTMTVTFILCLPMSFFSFRFFNGLIPIELDRSSIVATLFSVVLFTLLWCGYVQFVFAFDTSPSLRVLVELLARGGKMSRIELTNLMNFPLTFHRRFQRALSHQAIQIHLSPDVEKRYLNTGTGKRFAAFGNWAKKFFRFGRGG